MMPDRENVITHLQIINIWAAFARERDLQFFTAKRLEDIVSWTDDALALLNDYDTQLQYRDDHIAEYEKEIKRLEGLLKEQEAVEPLPQNSNGWVRTIKLWYCGACHSKISRRTSKYCPNCGKPILWEGR